MATRKASRKGNAARTDRAMERVLERFREWGRKGAKQRLRVLSSAERSRIARNAARARWKKKAT